MEVAQYTGAYVSKNVAIAVRVAYKTVNRQLLPFFSLQVLERVSGIELQDKLLMMLGSAGPLFIFEKMMNNLLKKKKLGEHNNITPGPGLNVTPERAQSYRVITSSAYSSPLSITC